MKNSVRHILIVAGLFSVLLFFFFYEITLGGKTFKTGTMIAGSMPYGTYGQAGNYGPCCASAYRETASMEEPFFEFLKTSFQQGVFPLWNPHQCCGLPTSLSMDASIFFPLSAIYYLFPNNISMDILFLVRLLVAGLLMYWLMCAWGFGLYARIAAALTFALTGPMVVYHAGLLNTDLILPLLFLSIFQAFSYGTRGFYLLFSASVALSISGGHAEHIFLTHFLAMAYAFFLLWQRDEITKEEKFRRAKGLFLFYFLGIGLSAFILWPFLADLAYTWTTHTDKCGSFAQPILEWLSKIVTVFVPTFFKKAIIAVNGETYNWGGGYLGVVATLMVALGLWSRKQRGFVVFFAVTAFLAYGAATSSFYTQWIGYLPIFNLLRLPAHVLYIFIFAVAILSGAGVEEMLARPVRSFKRSLGIALGIAVVIFAYLFIYRHAEFASQAFQASGLTLGILALAAFWIAIGILCEKVNPKIIVSGLLVLLIAEFFVYAPRCRPKRFDTFPRVPYVEFLKARTRDPYFRSQGLFLAFYRNTAMAYGVDSFVGSHTVLPYRYAMFVQRLVTPNLFSKICPGSEEILTEQSAEQGLFANSDILTLANVQYFVLPEKTDLGPQVVYDGEAQIIPLGSFVPVPGAIPRAYLTYNWTVKAQGQDEEILSVLEEKRLGVVPEVIIEKSPQDQVLSPQEPLLRRIDLVEEKMRWANGVVLKASTDRQALLVLLDAYFPGWKAWVNGQPVKIYPANYLFRGVFLPPGEHIVEFRFVPFWFYAGLAVSLISFFGFIYLLLKRKQKE